MITRILFKAFGGDLDSDVFSLLTGRWAYNSGGSLSVEWGGGLKAVVYGAVERRDTAKILHKTRTFGISLPSITGRGSNHVFM